MHLLTTGPAAFEQVEAPVVVVPQYPKVVPQNLSFVNWRSCSPPVWDPP